MAEIFMVEVVFHAMVTRMHFRSKLRANNARRKIAKHMGLLRNESVVEITSDASTCSIDCREVKSVAVINTSEWDAITAQEIARQKTLFPDGIPAS